MPPRQRETAAARTERLINEAVAANTVALKAQHDKRMEDYKQRVHDVAKEVQREQGWCNDGLRDRMKELDIDVKSAYTVTATVRIRIEDQVDDDDASANVDDLISSALNSYAGDHEIGDIDISIDDSYIEED